ncbi:hypothetical protein COCC4DRAFT_34023, partial [Bipolaris maydis ATCC 48331]
MAHTHTHTHVHVPTKGAAITYTTQQLPTHLSRAQCPATHKPTANTPLGRLRHTRHKQTKKKVKQKL